MITMNRKAPVLILVLSILSETSAFPQLLSSACFENSEGLTAQQAADRIVDGDPGGPAMDANGDGVLSEAEIIVHLIVMAGHTAASAVPMTFLQNLDFNTLNTLGNLINLHLFRTPFVRVWSQATGDGAQFIGAYFDAYDADQDGTWTVTEMDGVRADVMASVASRSGVLTVEECKTYVEKVYTTQPTCAPAASGQTAAP